MGIILGLIAALCWGAADFVARSAARRLGAFSALYFMQFVGLGLLLLYLLPGGELARVLGRVEASDWLWGAAASAAGLLAALSLYRALEIGVVAVVAPITASYAAVTVILAMLSGEHLSSTRALGIVAALAGVSLAALERGAPSQANASTGRRIPAGVGLAMLASIGFGLNFWMLGFHVIPVFGGVVSVAFIRVFTILTLPLVALALRQRLPLPRGRAAWGLVIAVGVLDTAGFVAGTLGLATEQVSVVSVLTSLYSAVTVVLAALLLRERLARGQWGGVGLIFAGVFLVSV